jgi:protein-S-isoprenylcysteine O-methyltransferase Ste14
MKLALFIICSIGLAWFSWWFSIKDKRYHGIYRYFAFECILALFLVNYIYWFVEPFSAIHILSWISLLISLVYLIWGIYLLFKIGKPKGKIENTTNLITTGLYKYIRHPLYGSILFLGTGEFFKNIDIWTTMLFLINIIALHFTAKEEEKEMIQKFRGVYNIYKQNSKMFIPFLY